MVVFTCQHCNESLKRTAVAKHYATRCSRNAPYLTCIDCLKDFSGDDYNDHNSCITEDERYGDKNYKAKPAAVKQMAWVDVVHSCANKNKNSKYKVLFSKLVTYDNVPRKQKKFLNFIKSSMPGFSSEISSEVFDVIENEFQNQRKITSKEENDSKGDENCNESPDVKVENDTDTKEKKKNKKKSIESSETCEVVPNVVNGEVVIKKKNKKKSIESSETCEVVPNVDNGEVVIKKKKSKKFSKFSPEDIEAMKSADIGDIFNINHAAKDDVQTNGFFHETSEELKGKENIQDNQNNTEENNLESENKEKLSKKELKKLKKKQKYEAELKDIEESINVDCTAENNCENIEEHNDNDLTKALKKRKKRKGAISESEADVGKRLKVEDAEEMEICTKDDEAESEEKQNKGNIKFNWEEVIKEVLRKSSDQEMSIKRISKKVIAEYQTVKGNRESYEQLLSKFNKKINRTVGVRVLKDRAKLLISDE